MEMLAAAWARGVITLLFVAICVLLIIVILLQKGRGGGLAGAFGGAGGHSAFGAKTGDMFTWVTIVLTAMFVVVAVFGNYVFVPEKAADMDIPAITSPDAPAEDGAAGGEPVEPATTTQPGS